MDSGRKTRVIVGALLGLLFVGIVALGSVFRTVVFTVAAVIAVYEKRTYSRRPHTSLRRCASP